MASKAPGLTATIDEISQEIDLENLIGVKVGKDKALLREIAQEVIDYMIDRTQVDRKELGGQKPLKSPYSKSYSESKDFKAAGKSRTKVDLTLSGDMLGSIDLVEESNSGFKIAIAADQTPKAFGHISGFEGHPVLRGPKRPFFGVTKDELITKILPKFKADLIDIAENEAKNQKEAEKIVRKIKVILEEDRS